VSLSNFFLTRPKVLKMSKVLTSMRVSRLVEMAHEWRFLREGPPLLKRLVMMPRQRRTYQRKLSRLMQSLLQRCECLRVDSFWMSDFCRI
jgi:hypothetical protein